MDIQELRASVRGALLQPGDPGYDAARRVWNGAIDRKPALIARCTGAADVLAAVNFARSHELLVSRCAAAATTSPATPSATAA